MIIKVTNKLIYHKEHILDIDDVPEDQKEMVTRLVKEYQSGDIETNEFLSTLNVMFGRRPFNGSNFRTGWPFIMKQIEGLRGEGALKLSVDIDEDD